MSVGGEGDVPSVGLTMGFAPLVIRRAFVPSAFATYTSVASPQGSRPAERHLAAAQRQRRSRLQRLRGAEHAPAGRAHAAVAVDDREP